MTKLRAVFRRRWLMLVIGVLAGMAAGAMSAAVAQAPDDVASYQVSQLVVANRNAAQSGDVEQDTLRVVRGSVAVEAAKLLGEEDPQALAKSVSATANPDSSSIEVVTTDPDPERATARVSAVVQAFLTVVNSDLLADQEKKFAEMQQQIDEAAAQLAAFDAANPGVGAIGVDPNVGPTLLDERQRLQEQLASRESQFESERLNAQATLPYSTLGPDAPTTVKSDLLPVPTSLPFRVVLLGAFGLALAVGLVMVLERVSPRIDTRDELASAVELPVLGEVGCFPGKRLPRNDDGTLTLDGPWAEPYRRIRSAIQFVQATGPPEDPARVIMFTSPSPGEGKSTTSAVTGIALAEAGVRTLVVGGDYRRPSVHKLLGAPASPGIREHSVLDIDRPTARQIVHATGHRNLYVSPSGEPHKEVVGLADAAKDLIVTAVEEGATVVVDTSPVEVANDAIDLLPVVDDVIVVVRSGRTTLKSLDHTLEQLRLHGARLMGTVLIGTPGAARQQYYYGYYTSPNATEPTQGKSRKRGGRRGDGSAGGPNGPARGVAANEPSQADTEAPVLANVKQADVILSETSPPPSQPPVPPGPPTWSAPSSGAPAPAPPAWGEHGHAAQSNRWAPHPPDRPAPG